MNNKNISPQEAIEAVKRFIHESMCIKGTVEYDRPVVVNNTEGPTQGMSFKCIDERRGTFYITWSTRKLGLEISNHAYLLSYVKNFKDGSSTKHERISMYQENLLKWMFDYSKEIGLTLEKSQDPNHEFLFLDGDWVYEGTSDYVNITFTCVKKEMI